MPSWSMCECRLPASRLAHSSCLVSSTPTRLKPMMPLGELVARVEQLVAGHDLRHQADALGLVGVDVAAGEHDVERAREADLARQQVADAELARR